MKIATSIRGLLLSLGLALALTSPIHAQLYEAFGNNTMSEYDGLTGALLNSVTTPNNEQLQTVTVVGGIVYVAGTDSATTELMLSTYNASNLATITAPTNVTALITDSPYEVGNTGYGYAAGIQVANGNIYINNNSYGESHIVTVNQSTGAVNANFINDLYDNFTDFVISPDGSTLYAADYGRGFVEEYNAVTGATINTQFAAVGGQADDPDYGTASSIAMDGNTLYVLERGTNEIGTYDATTGALIDSDFISIPDGSGDNLFISSITDVAGIVYASAIDGTTYTFKDSTGAEVSDNIPAFEGGGAGIAALPGGELFSDNPGAAPEPRSWAFACGVLAIVGLLRRKNLALLV